MDSIPKKMPTQNTTKKPGKAIFIKPGKTISANKQSERKFLKRCKTIPTEKTASMMLITPCETVSGTPMKRRRVIPGEVEDKKKEEEEEEKDPKFKFKQGNHVDVKALLSSKARNFLITSKGGEVVPIADLDKKFVMVCCFLVPFDADDQESVICHSVEALYTELTFKGIADRVKLVVIVKIAPGFGKDEFDSFFSRLSVNCLAIPFADSKSREKICKSFGLFTPGVDSREVPCLVVHPNGKVLQFDPYFLEIYGARSFPFTREHFDAITRQDKITRNRIRSTDSPIFLEELLQCDYLSRIANENDYIPTSSLGDTVVALYLCYDGNIMVKLQNIHKKCFDKGLKFEVVLVPLPFHHHYETPFFHDRIKEDALKHPISSSWFTFPFDDKVYRTLCRLFYCSFEDQLIILPHGKSLGDPCGKEIATCYGISAYPFTRDVLINKKISELRSLTIQELINNTDMPNLQNKNVLLYFDFPTFFFDGGDLYNHLKRDYHEIKAKYTDSEVIFVSLQPKLKFKDSRIAEMKWPILPRKLCASVINHIFPHYSKCTTLVAFGKDGKILSLSAVLGLPVSTSSTCLFDDTLASEIAAGVDREIRDCF